MEKEQETAKTAEGRPLEKELIADAGGEAGTHHKNTRAHCTEKTLDRAPAETGRRTEQTVWSEGRGEHAEQTEHKTQHTKNGNESTTVHTPRPREHHENTTRTRGHQTNGGGAWRVREHLWVTRGAEGSRRMHTYTHEEIREQTPATPQSSRTRQTRSKVTTSTTRNTKTRAHTGHENTHGHGLTGARRSRNTGTRSVTLLGVEEVGR